MRRGLTKSTSSSSGVKFLLDNQRWRRHHSTMAMIVIILINKERRIGRSIPFQRAVGGCVIRCKKADEVDPKYQEIHPRRVGIRPISANHPKNDCETVAIRIHIQLLLLLQQQTNKQTPSVDRGRESGTKVVRSRKLYGGRVVALGL